MSISYCVWCERIAEHPDDKEIATDPKGIDYVSCVICGEEITEFNEDPPDAREALNKEQS